MDAEDGRFVQEGGEGVGECTSPQRSRFRGTIHCCDRCVTIWGGGSVVPGGGGEEKVYWFWSKGIVKRAEELPSPKEGATCNAVWVEEVGGNVATSGVHG